MPWNNGENSRKIIYLSDDFPLELEAPAITLRGGVIPPSQFLLKICLDPELATKMLSALDYGALAIYGEDCEKVVAPFFQALENIEADGSPCGSGQFPPDSDEYCNEYQPDSYILEYSPNDPFQTPNFVPSGYGSPPFKAYPFADNVLPDDLLNFQEKDVIFSLFATHPPSLVNFLGQLELMAQITLHGFPKIRVNFTGVGTVELHLLKVILGGMAIIVPDSDMSKAKTVDLNAVNFSDNIDLQSLVQAVLTGIGTSILSVPTTIFEMEFTTGGEHTVDVHFVPNLSLDGLFTWGGGLRKVVLCNEELVGVANQMPQFRVNQQNLQVEWKPNETHTQWEGIGQVIYPITMQTDPTNTDLIQYTLQPIPIGGGADPFQQWVNLLEVNTNTLGIAGANATTLPAGSEATASIDSSRILQLGIPAGQNGTDGENPELRVSGGYIQWKLETSGTWNNLIAVSSLVGSSGQNGASPELRVSGGYIQWKLTTSGTWNNLIAIADLEGQDGVCIDPCGDIPETDGTQSDANRCGKALYLQDFVWTIYQEQRTAVEATLSIPDTVATVIGGIPALGWTIDGIYDAIRSLIDLGGFTLLDVQDTLANREKLQKAWYCVLDNTDTLSQEQYNTILGLIADELPTPLAEAIEYAFRSVTYEEMAKRAWIGAKGGGNCAGFECAPTYDWTHVIESPFNGVVVYTGSKNTNSSDPDVPNGLYQDYDSGQDMDVFSGAILMSGTGTIEHVEIEWGKHPTTPTAYFGVAIGGDFIYSGNTEPQPITWTGSHAIGNLDLYNTTQDAPAGYTAGYTYITKITISGNGQNPFV